MAIIFFYFKINIFNILTGQKRDLNELKFVLAGQNDRQLSKNYFEPCDSTDTRRDILIEQLTVNDWSPRKHLILYSENLNVSREDVDGNIEIREKKLTVFFLGTNHYTLVIFYIAH